MIPFHSKTVKYKSFIQIKLWEVCCTDLLIQTHYNYHHLFFEVSRWILCLIFITRAFYADYMQNYRIKLSKDASFFTHYYSHNVYSIKIELNLEAKNALEK
jgi:hypothetical protein